MVLALADLPLSSRRPPSDLLSLLLCSVTLFVFTVVSLLCDIVFTVVYCRLHFSRQIFLDLIEEVDAIIDKSVC